MKFSPAGILPACIETEKLFGFIVLVSCHLCSSFFLFDCLAFIVPAFQPTLPSATLHFVLVAYCFGIAFVFFSAFQPTLPSAHFAGCARCVLFWYYIRCPCSFFCMSAYFAVSPLCSLCSFRIVLVLHSLYRGSTFHDNWKS